MKTHDILVNTKLNGIEVFKFEILPKPQDFKLTTYDTSITQQFKIGKEKNLVLSVLDIEVKDKETNLKLSSIEIGVGFTIDNFDALVADKGEGFNPRFDISENLAYLLRSISVSTARGILYSNLKGSYLDKAILPIVQVENLEIDQLKDKKVKTLSGGKKN